MVNESLASLFLNTKLSVLLLEDNDADAEIICTLLSKSRFYTHKVTHVVNISDALTLLENNYFNIGLIDQRLGGTNSGVDFAHLIGGRSAKIPMIMLTGYDEASIELEAANAGIYDYLSKDNLNPAALDKSIRFALMGFQFNQNLKTTAERAKKQTTIIKNILSLISHEMQSPLASLKGYTEFIVDNSKETPIVDAASKMNIASRHLEDFISNIIEFIRIDNQSISLRTEPFDIKKLINEVVLLFEPYAIHKGISIKVDTDQVENSVFVGDRLRVRQILINIMKNAIKYSDGGAVLITSNYAEGILTTKIKDHGIGMSAELRTKILSSSELTVNPDKSFGGGLGLGLSICQKLVFAMGGEIDIESVPGFGTTVRISIPLQEA